LVSFVSGALMDAFQRFIQICETRETPEAHSPLRFGGSSLDVVATPVIAARAAFDEFVHRDGVGVVDRGPTPNTVPS
jgi:hypothetical protein